MSELQKYIDCECEGQCYDCPQEQFDFCLASEQQQCEVLEFSYKTQCGDCCHAGKCRFR